MRFAYGLVAMVAMTPLIVLQALGLWSVLTAKAAARRLAKAPSAAPVLSEAPVAPVLPTAAEVPVPASAPAMATDEIEVIDL